MMRAALAPLLLATSLLAGCSGDGGGDGDGNTESPCDGVTRAGLQLSQANHTAVALATAEGCIVAELYDDKAPITVRNFLDYTEAGFFDDTLIHRISKEFVLQGGGFDAATGALKDTEPAIKNEARTSGLHNTAYTFSMARSSGADTATSQFFINVKDNSDCLDAVTGRCDPQRNGYAVFAVVVQGREVVDALHALPVTTSDAHPYCIGLEDRQGGSCPVDPVILQSVRVVS